MATIRLHIGDLLTEEEAWTPHLRTDGLKLYGICDVLPSDVCSMTCPFSAIIICMWSLAVGDGWVVTVSMSNELSFFTYVIYKACP